MEENTTNDARNITFCFSVKEVIIAKYPTGFSFMKILSSLLEGGEV